MKKMKMVSLPLFRYMFQPMKTTIFAGQYCQMMDADLESASLIALLYMQKASILIIDDLNFPELQRCQKEVVRAGSWSDIFEHETAKLNTKVSSLERELASLKKKSALQKPIQQALLIKGPNQQVLEPPTKQEFTEVVPIANKSHNRINGPDAEAIAIQQGSTPPYKHQHDAIFGSAKKVKENNKAEYPSLSATAAADESTSRIPTKKGTTRARRALFISKGKSMDA